MSTNYSTTNQSYKHLSEAERGEIEAYLSVGLKLLRLLVDWGEIVLLFHVKLIVVP